MAKSLPNLPKSKIKNCQACPYLRFWQQEDRGNLKVACQLSYFSFGTNRLDLMDNVLMNNIPVWCPLEEFKPFAALIDTF